MKNKDIGRIILNYCEGFEHLEFNYSDLPEMAEKIKEELERELAELKCECAAVRREAEEFRDDMNVHLTEGDGKFTWEDLF